MSKFRRALLAGIIVNVFSALAVAGSVAAHFPALTALALLSLLPTFYMAVYCATR